MMQRATWKRGSNATTCTISSVTAFGIFVALDEVYVEGLVHVSELGSDYFQFDQAKHQMLGERSGKRYRLGDRVHVKIVRVSLETSRIDFVLTANESSDVSDEASVKKQKTAKRKTKR
jgi:ribonuclease R